MVVGRSCSGLDGLGFMQLPQSVLAAGLASSHDRQFHSPPLLLVVAVDALL